MRRGRNPFPRLTSSQSLTKGRGRRTRIGSFCATEALESRTHLAADLAASLTYAGGTYYPGQHLTGGTNVTAAILNTINVGDADADNFHTRIVLSTDTTLGNADDIAFDDIIRAGDPLTPGTISRQSQTLTIGSSFAAGRYFIIVKADATDAVADGCTASGIIGTSVRSRFAPIAVAGDRLQELRK